MSDAAVEPRATGFRVRIEALTCLVIATVSLAVFVACLIVVLNHQATYLNSRVDGLVLTHFGDRAGGWPPMLTHVGAFAFDYAGTALVLFWGGLWLFRIRLRRRAMFFVGSVVNMGLLTRVLQEVVTRPSPYVHGPHSFPSGHAADSLVFYGAVVYLLWLHVRRPWSLFVGCGVAVPLILLVGLSRVALDVHDPIDVLGGYALGSTWLGLWVVVFGQSLTNDRGQTR